MVDCDKDKDCKRGLLCAEAHPMELRALGYNQRKAYCGKVGKKGDEVCYDPKKLKKLKAPTQPPVKPPTNDDGVVLCPSTASANTKCTPGKDFDSCVVGPKFCCPDVRPAYDNTGTLICGGEQSCSYIEGCQCSTEGMWMCYMASIMCPDPELCYPKLVGPPVLAAS